ncbi:MAG: hypothetical protein JSR44_11975 [Spirochaetes bacterium]|nr:hypothetical protein [Spirochaetota bacterium]
MTGEDFFSLAKADVPLIAIGLLSVLLLACGSRKFLVTDDNFFRDGYPLESNYIQFVELVEEKNSAIPTKQRFEQNCILAEEKARSRFHSAYPQAKDSGMRLSEHFEKSAACRVRMAFRIS